MPRSFAPVSLSPRGHSVCRCSPLPPPLSIQMQSLSTKFYSNRPLGPFGFLAPCTLCVLRVSVPPVLSLRSFWTAFAPHFRLPADIEVKMDGGKPCDHRGLRAQNILADARFAKAASGRGLELLVRPASLGTDGQGDPLRELPFPHLRRSLLENCSHRNGSAALGE